MLTVLTWLWRQDRSRAAYSNHHVNILADMVRRNLSMPHKFSCVTDNPEGIDPSVEIIKPPGEFLDIRNPRWTNGKPQCYRRLSMYRRDAAKFFGKRFVCMDLDCVVGGPLDPLFDRPEDLVLFKGTSANRPYNGSMQLITAGCRPQVYETFSQEAALESGAQFCGSDQAWLAHCLGWDEATWDEADGVYFYGPKYRRAHGREKPRVMFFPGTIKPWTAARLDKFVRANYRIEMREAA
jgi:hypothetical protein